MTDTENTEQEPEQPDETTPDEQDPDEVESHEPIEGPRPDDAVEYDAPNVGEHMNKEDE
jgi:hypothetical protein